MTKYTNCEWLGLLPGRSVVSASLETGRMVLSDGTVLVFDKENWDCCSWVDLTGLATTENIITLAEPRNNETDGVGPYKAWIHVVTKAGELHLADADGDASNGYYLHGFALGVTVIDPDSDRSE